MRVYTLVLTEPKVGIMGLIVSAKNKTEARRIACVYDDDCTLWLDRNKATCEVLKEGVVLGVMQ